jgi:hypothetical protein
MFQRLNENKDLLIVAVASFFIGFGAASFFGNDSTIPSALDDNNEVANTLPLLPFKESTDPIEVEPMVVEVSPSMQKSNESLRVENQRAGETVQVQQAVLVEPRWMVVREIYANGEVGNILGAKWQVAGEYENITVKLLRGTVGGEQYQVTLFADSDGDKKFNHEVDESLAVSVQFATVASPGAF